MQFFHTFSIINTTYAVHSKNELCHTVTQIRFWTQSCLCGKKMTNVRYASISNRVLIVWPCACPGSLNCVHLYTSVYLCILLHTSVYLCILRHTCVYFCIPVYMCMYTSLYSLGLPSPLRLDSNSKQCNIYEQCNSPNNRICDCKGATNESPQVPRSTEA